jgi:hypothetical protein
LISEDHVRLNLVRYLAADLTAEEHALFEERLLMDQDFSDAVAVHEQDLIDAYALRSLSPDEARSVQLWIEASPSRMQRVSMARALLVRRPQRIRKKQRIVIVLATAACILAAVGITLNLTSRSIRQNSKSPSSGTIVTPENGILPTSLGNATKPEVILLVAERIRGEQQITTYQISPNVPVQFQVLLAGESASSDYTLKLVSHDAKQHVLLERRNLKARVEGGQSYVEATFPPGSLPPGDYRALVGRRGSMFNLNFVVR